MSASVGSAAASVGQAGADAAPSTNVAGSPVATIVTRVGQIQAVAHTLRPGGSVTVIADSY